MNSAMRTRVSIALAALAALGLILPMCLSYPRIGQDFDEFMPRFLDTFGYQKNEGLKIQWWTPTFAGGFPVFANPQDMQFSLAQWLLHLMPPFHSYVVSIFLFCFLGGLALCRVGSHCLQLSLPSTALLVMGATINGFYMMHAASGHVTFQAYPRR